MSNNAFVAVSGVVAFALVFLLNLADVPARPILSDPRLYEALWFGGLLIGSALSCTIIARKVDNGKVPPFVIIIAIIVSIPIMLISILFYYRIMILDAENYSIFIEITYFLIVASFAFIASFGFPVLRKFFL